MVNRTTRLTSQLNTKRVLSVLIFTLSLCTPIQPSLALTYVNFSEPNATGPVGTVPTDISNGLIVGFYDDSLGHDHGFLYNGTTFTTLDDPLGFGTELWGISGNDIVGTYFVRTSPTTIQDHGFVYDGTSFSTVDDSLGINTVLYGIDGDMMVGEYQDAAYNYHGVVYNASTATFTPFDYPHAAQTILRGISGDKIVGEYINQPNPAGTGQFLYDGSSFTALAVSEALDISGNLIAGANKLFDGVTYTPVQDSTYPTFAYGVDGNDVVGTYVDMSGRLNGFYLHVPEPSSFILAALGLVALFRCLYRGKVLKGGIEVE